MKKDKKYYLLSLLICASCTNIVTNTIPSKSPTPSILPSNKINTTSSPTVIPSIQTSIIPSSTPSINISSTPSPISTVKTTDISESATVNGKVYDDGGNSLDNIKVSIKSLDTNINFSGESNTVNGSYVFRNVPVGVRLEITAFKSDSWTKRVQTYVAKSNLQGVSVSNVLDFGDSFNIGSIEKQNFYFLSDLPEVLEVRPKNQLLKYDQMAFTLVFSEPVKKESIEKNLYLRYLGSSTITPSTILGDGTNGTDNTDGPPLLKGNKQIIIDEFVGGRKFVWDTSNFDDYGKEVTFSFDGSNGVITDNKSQVKYGLTLRKNSREPRIIDRAGNLGIIEGEFFMNPTRARNIVFNVESDRRSPYIESLVLLKNSDNCIIRINYSELMILEGSVNTDVSDLSFYKFYRNGQLIDLTNSKVNLITRKGIEILAPTSTFNVGDKIKVEVDPNLKDPAGNFISQGVSLNDFDNIRETQYNP